MRDYSVMILLIPLGFACKKNRPVVIALLVFSAYAILFVLSKREPSLALFGKLPFADLFRIPERILAFQEFAVGVAGAVGLSLLQRGNMLKLWDAEKKKRVFSWVYVFICLLAIPFPLLFESAKLAIHPPMYGLIHLPWTTVALILLLYSSNAASRTKLVGACSMLALVLLGLALHKEDMLHSVGRHMIVLNSFLIFFAVIVLISTFASRLPSWIRKSGACAIAVVVLLNVVPHRTIQVRRPVPALTEIDDVDSLFDERIGWIKDNAGYDRVLMAAGLLTINTDLGYMYQFHHINSYEPFTQTRWKHFVRSILGPEKFDDMTKSHQFYGIINPNIQGSFFKQPRMIGLPSLRYIATRRLLANDKTADEYQDAWSLIHGGDGEDSKFFVYENRFALPRAYLAKNYFIAHDEEAALDAIRENISKLPYSVVLENGRPSFPSAEFRANPGNVRIKKYGINEVELEVAASEPCLVVLTDCFYPGWKALVDGEERPILRANSLFRAVDVSAGDHTVIFRYRPASLFAGAAISVASIFLILAGLLVERHYAKTR
ncbi:MAG: YfhO family protein [Candidatus Abyssubacteria bacterium]|nr:YfhO family protein [Candidatus Abyssubacteria bacterium]